MILPFKDDNPTRGTPILTYSIIAICVMVFLYQLGLGEQELRRFFMTFGFVPGSFFAGADVGNAGAVTLFTSMFMHGGFMHLAGNMLYLWIFADNIECIMGRTRFILFYVLCGLAAVFAHGLLEPTSTIPMIGASGAISGVLGAYLLLYPRANITVFLALYIIWQTINVPAWIVLGAWFGMQLFGVITSSPGEPGVAFWAHIGGFVAGMVLVKFFIPAGEHLFHDRNTRPWERRSSKRGPWDKARELREHKQDTKKGPWG